MVPKTATLESLCELIIDCPHSTPEWTDEGVVVLRNQNIRNGILDLTSPSFTHEEDYKKRIKRAVPQAGDIVFTREAPMGEVCVIPKGLKCCLGQRQVLLRPKPDVSGEYLFWALQSPYVQHQISWNEGTGTTVSNVRIPALKALEIPRHPKDEAEAAGILNSIASKIDLNRQMNETLEQMAQALFKSWFVDFDPVIDNALDAGKPIPEELELRVEQRRQLRDAASRGEVPLPGLPDDIHSLFPNEFELTDEMGWIPKGWNCRPVSEAINVNPKVKLSKGTVAKFVDMKAMPTSGYSISEIIEKSYSGGAKFKQHDVLLARITPCLENGKTGLVDFLSDDEVGFGSTEFIVLRGRNNIGFGYISGLARNASFRKHCIQNMVGSSGRQRVQNSCFDSFFIAFPSEASVLDLYDETFSDFFIKITSNKSSSMVLSDLRDSLLPKLISGELQIPDAEQQIAEVMS